MRVVDIFLSLIFLVPACFAFAMVQAGSGKAAAAPRETWVHKFATVNGVKLHYVEQGKGPVILFLHGFPEFWYEWKDLLPEFGKDHRASKSRTVNSLLLKQVKDELYNPLHRVLSQTPSAWDPAQAVSVGCPALSRTCLVGQ